MDMMVKKCSWFNTNTGLLVLRIGVGAIFIFSGYMKASDMAGTVGFFATVGFSAFWAYLVTAVELLGGLGVLLGVRTRFFAMFLTVVMIVAIYLLRTNMTMVMTPLSVFFSTLTLFFAGGGSYSLMKEKMEMEMNSAQ